MILKMFNLKQQTKYRFNKDHRDLKHNYIKVIKLICLKLNKKKILILRKIYQIITNLIKMK